MHYPKVLIVGNQFDIRSGGGITMTNLFFGWDKNNIAVASSVINNPDFSVCEKYYRIGDQEFERRFPFSFGSRKHDLKSGIVLKNNDLNKLSFSINKKTSKLTKIKDYILDFTGQIHRRRRLVVSKEFSKWIRDFAPDIIYSQLSSYELIQFITVIQSKLMKPVVLHMMDDWPVSISSKQKGIFKLYWAHRIDIELRDLFKKANVLMSISESMSEAYYTRYNQTFIPFHNPITIKDWLPHSKKDWSIKDVFKILYAGRIGTANNKSILFISNVIERIKESGIKIKLDIYTTDANSELAAVIREMSGVEVKDAVQYSSMPSLLSSYDLLFLPLDFDKEGIKFARYSMPTKASEYMISGTPILVFADTQTALVKHALKYKWAYVVSENSKEKLQMAITELYMDQELRKTLGSRAKEFALINYNSEKIRENFKNAILNHSQPSSYI